MDLGRIVLLLVLALSLGPARPGAGQGPQLPWKHQIDFPDDPFASWTWPPFIKFAIITKDGYDPNVVYFQDCTQYEYHFDFALQHLDPFLGMTLEQFDGVTLHAAGQQAVLGAVILPPWHDPPFGEYGIQLARTDPYTPEETVRWFNLVKAAVLADPNVRAYYFPTFEQYPVTQQNRAWLEAHGVPVGSTAQWAEGNASYAQGWALGTLRFIPGADIQRAYTAGELSPEDILLTDGVPAEVPSVAGIVTLTPSTPNSHVAILARSQGVPFVHLAVEGEAARAGELVGHNVYLAVTESDFGGGCVVKLLDVESLHAEQRTSLLALKEAPPLVIQPMTSRGKLWADTNDLGPEDICFFGGKAANFGVLRRALPNDSPRAMAFSFDLWNAFLDQPIAPTPPLVIAPGEYLLLWADGDPEQGPRHLDFKLSNTGEAIGLFDRDGVTLIDSVSFGSQRHDISYGRSSDGGLPWRLFENPTPGGANAGAPQAGRFVINEVMAWNKATIEDPDEAHEFPDWIELYNGTPTPVTLSGMFLTDDMNEPTQWQVPPATTAPTLRDEIVSRLAQYAIYPPAEMKMLAADLLTIRGLFMDPRVTSFAGALESAVIDALHTFDFDPSQPIRFRSSTNVEDSAQFTGAGLYESHSGRLLYEETIFSAIREVFASFYNDNAFLERLKYRINETQVGMSLLVHHSFSDEIELANGVATLETSYDQGWSAHVVSQMGAVSVTNPPLDAVPEEIRIDAGFDGPMPQMLRRSSLLPLRDQAVLEWDVEYVELYGLLTAAADLYCEETQKDDIVLDFEFKKVAPEGRLVIKQIREIPRAGGAEYATPFLLAEPKTYWLLQGRGSNVFTNHRLKSRWTLTPKNVWLDAEGLQSSTYDQLTVEYVADGLRGEVMGDPMLLPDASHTFEPAEWEFDAYTLIDGWRFPDLGNPRTYRLRSEPLFQATVPDPVVTLGDFRLSVTVEHRQAVPTDLDGGPTAMSEDFSLYEPWQPTEQDVPEECVLDDPNTGVAIRTRFYARWGWGWDSPTSVQFESTRIEGLTTEPIVLTGCFSQSVGGGAHLCPKNFLFEPGLEPGISPAILDELRARNVRLIYFTTGARECRPTEQQDTPPFIRLLGFNEPIE